MKRFFKYAKKKASGHSDRRSLGSLGSLASVSVASSSDHGSVYSLTGDNPGYSIDLKSTDKSFTKLHRACWLNDFDKVKKHIKKEDVNALDSERRTPLHLACARGSKEIIWFLLGSKAEINARDSEGYTPLLKIIQCHHISIIQFLLDRGADLKISDSNENTALHLATKDNLLDVASVLLDKGINIDAVNKDGKSSIHIATENGNTKLVELFLLHGASVNIQDNDFRTCLMLAAENGSEEIIKLLLEYGADSTLIDSRGWTCKRYAEVANNPECLKLIGETEVNNSPHLKQENSLRIGPVVDTNFEHNGHVEQQLIESDKENSPPGSFADSWSDSTDEEPKKVMLKDLNLTKFLASVEVSDAESSDKEDGKDLENLVIAPPKPPRTHNNGKNSEPKIQIENIPVITVTEDNNKTGKSFDTRNVQEKSVLSGKDLESTSAGDGNIPFTSSVTHSSENHFLSSDISFESDKEMDLVTNKNEQLNILDNKIESIDKEDLQTEYPFDESITSDNDDKSDLHISENKHTVYDEYQRSEVNLKDENDEIKNMDISTSTDKESLRISIANVDHVNSEEPKTNKQKHESQIATDSSINVSESGNKQHLYQKKSDVSNSRHSRTPSGNIPKDVHPLVDLSNPLTDSEESNWDSGSDLSLADNTGYKMAEYSPLKTTENKNNIDYKIKEINNNFNDLVMTVNTNKDDDSVIKEVKNEISNNLASSQLSNAPQSPTEMHNESLVIKEDGKEKESSDIQIDNLIPSQENDNENLKNFNSDDNPGESQFTHQEKVQNETNKEEISGEKEMPMIVLDEMKDLSNGSRSVKGNFIEGTLGREDTLQGVEEIWEKNASLELPICTPDSDTSSESKTSVANTITVKNLVRQNAVTEDETVKSRESKYYDEHVNKLQKKDIVNSQIKKETEENILIKPNEEQYLSKAKPYNVDQPSIPKKPTRKVKEIRQHFEGLINDSQTPMERPHSDITPPLRRLSLNTQFLEKILKPCTLNEKDSQRLNNVSSIKQKAENICESDSINRRRHSVSAPIVSTPSGLNFKNILMLKHSESKIKGENTAVTTQNTDDKFNSPFTGEDVNAKKLDEKVSFPGKINKATEFGENVEKCNNLTKNASVSKKKIWPTSSDVPSDLNSKRSSQGKSEKISLITSLEKFPGVKKLTKRFSLTSEAKTKLASNKKLLTSKSLSDSLEEEDKEKIHSFLNKDEAEEQEDFVQEVLERLDIRRRSSIGIMNATVENPRLKKLSHSSSLEILSESNSSLSSGSDVDIFKKASKKMQSEKLIGEHYDSMEDNELASELEDNDDNDDDDDDMKAKDFATLKMDPFASPMSKLKSNDPQSFIKVQNTLQDLCISLKEEKGERQILEDHLQNLTCERNNLCEQLDKLHDKYSELEEHSLEMESQLNMSQWELHLAKEQWKICEMNVKKLLENLQKKEEILLKESNLRQHSELCQNSLQSEFAMVSENLKALYSECKSLQSKISMQSINENSKTYADCAVNTEADPQESNREAIDFCKLQQKLEESQQLSQKLINENKCLQESLHHCEQNSRLNENNLAEIESNAKAKCEALKKSLDSAQEEIKINEEALNQATLSYMQQINALQTENKLLQDQIEKEGKNFSCLNNQILTLQNQLTATHALLKNSLESHENEIKMLQSAKEKIEKQLFCKDEELKMLLQVKQELINRLSLANKKMEDLEELWQKKQSSNSKGVDTFSEQMVHLQNELRCIKDHLASNQIQQSPLIVEVPKSTNFQTTQTSCNVSPTLQHRIVNVCCEHCAKLYPQPKPVCVDKSYQTEMPETHRKSIEMDKNLEEKKQLQAKSIKIQELEEQIINITKNYQKQIYDFEQEKQELLTSFSQVQQQLQVTKAKLSNSNTELFQSNSELTAIKKKTATLENIVTSSQEVAKKWENDYNDLISKWKETCRELDASTKRENNTLSSLNEMEHLFQNAKKQIQDFQLMYDESQKNVNVLENQLVEMETELNKTNETLHTIETKNSLAHQELKEKEKMEIELKNTITQLQSENSQLSQRLLADVTLQQQKWEMEARDRTDLAMKLIELEEKQQQSLGLLDKQQQNSSTLLNHNETLHRILEQEKKKNILLQEQILKLESLSPVKKPSLSLGTQYHDYASTHNISIPNEILEQIKDLKKQAEELKLRVKQEKDHRRQCELQLTKAKKELAELPQLRKSISYLEEVRKELKGHLTNLQKHIKNHCVDRQEVDKMRQYYEAMTCYTLQSKLGQVQSFLDEKNKVQEHLDQVRLNNETQVKLDLQKTMNELFEEVTQLRTSLHHSQSQVESLQDQCDRLQELYNNEVQLRSKLTEDLSKAQIKGSDQFTLTRKNILKSQKENFKELKSFDLAKIQLSCMPKNYMSGSEDSILYKLKSELNKSIQHHLSDDFPRNLNVIHGNGDQLFSSTKANNAN